MLSEVRTDLDFGRLLTLGVEDTETFDASERIRNSRNSGSGLFMVMTYSEYDLHPKARLCAVL